MRGKLIQSRGNPANMELSFRPTIWILGALFFVAATPFELAQSGFGYLIKAVALGMIVVYAVLVRGARTGRFNLLTILIFVSFFVINLAAWSERAVVAILTIGTGVLLGQARGERWNRDFYSVVVLFLAFHVGALILALAIFYTTGRVVELHGIIFPEVSRAEAYGTLARLSGLHTEPGTYSQWTLMALYLLALIRGELFSFWHALIATSVLLTFSLWGLLATGVFVFSFLLEAIVARQLSDKFKRLLGLIALVLLTIAAASAISSELRDGAVQFLSQKASLSTDSGLDKLEASRFFKENFASIFMFGEPLDPGFCPQCISPQDAGVAQTSTYYLGFVLFASLVFYVIVRTATRWNIGFVVPVLLILVWKAHIYEPLLWVIFGYVFRGPPRLPRSPDKGKNQPSQLRGE